MAIQRGNMEGIRKDVMEVMAKAVNTYEDKVKDLIQKYKEPTGAVGQTPADKKEISTAETMELQYIMNEVNIIASAASNIQKAIKDTQSSTIRNFV